MSVLPHFLLLFSRLFLSQHHALGMLNNVYLYTMPANTLFFTNCTFSSGKKESIRKSAVKASYGQFSFEYKRLKRGCKMGPKKGSQVQLSPRHGFFARPKNHNGL